MSGGSWSSTPTNIRPSIAEILRTKVLPASLLLRVVRITAESIAQRKSNDDDPASKVRLPGDRQSCAYRLYLSDEELMIQALLHHSLHYCVKTQDIRTGSVLDLKKFTVKQANRLNGQGRIVYFAIDDLEVVPATKLAVQDGKEGIPETFVCEDKSDGKDIGRSTKRKRKDIEHQNLLAPTVEEVHDVDMHSLPSSQESDGFETVPEQVESVRKRRQLIKALSATVADDQSRLASTKLEAGPEHTNNATPKLSPVADGERSSEEDKVAKSAPCLSASAESQMMNGTSETTAPSLPSIRNVSTSTPSRSLDAPPLHTLASLVDPNTPLPAKAYVLSIFALISWVSPSLIWRPHSPFPPKRHIKIHDPSISDRTSGITVSVFVDATHFKPRMGTVALFRGLIMRRWGGEVILNAYAHLKEVIWNNSDGETTEVAQSGWYVDDELVLRDLGFEVGRMKSWWEERSKGKIKG